MANRGDYALLKSNGFDGQIRWYGVQLGDDTTVIDLGENVVAAVLARGEQAVATLTRATLGETRRQAMRLGKRLLSGTAASRHRLSK